MKLTFLGATGTVTGSKYLLEDENHKFLIDCGLFQGLKELRQRNWNKLPVKPSDIDAVILTHAHIDHSGYLPILVRDGFKGPIYATEATIDLCKLLLPDSARIHEEDAARANRENYTKHKPALPLYTEHDAERALQRFKPVDFGKEQALNNILSFTYSRAGHILGAASIRVTDGQTAIAFSGDLGRPNDPVIAAPVKIQDADILLLESTYGDRLHEGRDPLDKMAEIINDTVARGGLILIPAFAVGRAQSLMFYLYELKRKNRIPNIPIFLDSPMAADATAILKKHGRDHRLSEHLCAQVCGVAKIIQSPEESRLLNGANMPCIIISASGMATGGRILHHLKAHIGDPKNTVLFAGYQAVGTRGARLVHGEKEIKIHGHLYPVRAQIDNLDTLSAHADYSEILDWLRGFNKPPRMTYLTHGEPEAASSLKFKIEEHLGWPVEIPEYLQTVEF